MTRGSEKQKKVRGVARRIIWMIRHGHREQETRQVQSRLTMKKKKERMADELAAYVVWRKEVRGEESQPSQS